MLGVSALVLRAAVGSGLTVLRPGAMVVLALCLLPPPAWGQSSDPLIAEQWHLKPRSEEKAGANVIPAWSLSRGEGVAWVGWLARAGGTWEALALAFLDSPEYVGGTRSLADHVAILYRTFLGREPDADGLAGWLGVVAEGLGPVHAAFTGSAEFRSRIAPLLR